MKLIKRLYQLFSDFVDSLPRETQEIYGVTKEAEEEIRRRNK